MKVLHLVAGGIIGGAGWGAYWFHQALRELGVESTLLTNAPDNGGDTLVIDPTIKSLACLASALMVGFGNLPRGFCNLFQ